MRMNAGIILAGQGPDILGNMARGQQAAQAQNDASHTNAFRAMLQQQGPGIMQGQENALASLAQFDPQAALGVQSTRQTMRIQEQQARQSYEAARRAAAAWAQSQDEATRAQTAAQVERALAMGTQAQTPEQWDQVMQQFAPQYAGQFDNRQMIIAGALGLADALRMGQGGQETPAAFQALHMRAVAAGMQPGTPEYQSFMAAGGRTPDAAPPDAIRVLQMRAEMAGLRPGTPEYQAFMASGGTPRVDSAEQRIERLVAAGFPRARAVAMVDGGMSAQDVAVLERGTGWRAATAEEAAEFGAAGGQFGPDGRFYPINPAGPSTVVNVNGEATGDPFFSRQLAERDAATFSQLEAQGQQAARGLVQMDALESALSRGGSGVGASLRLAAGQLGIPTEGLDDLQAAQAIIAQLVPQQRPPGSGPMSDRDVILFQQSLPRIINQPGGNRLIIDTIRRIAEHDIAVGRIATQVNTGQITREQARQQLATIADPMSEFRRATGDNGAPAAPASAARQSGPVTPEAIMQMPEADLLQLDVLSLDAAGLAAMERRLGMGQ